MSVCKQTIAYEVLSLMCESTWAYDLKEYVHAVQDELKGKYTLEQIEQVMDLQVMCNLLKPVEEKPLMLKGKPIKKLLKPMMCSGDCSSSSKTYCNIDVCCMPQLVEQSFQQPFQFPRFSSLYQELL